MLRTVVYVTAAVIADGCAGLAGALVPERRLEQSRQALVGLATGVLVGTTFLDLLPQALAGASHPAVLGVIAGSLAVMASFEWALGRRSRKSLGRSRFAAMLLGADAFHNAADGAAIAASFLISVRLGVITAFAVIAHEVPEELADYVLLRRSDLNRTRALVAMIGVQLTAGVGAALTLLSASAWRQVSGLALGIAAGTFLYIAAADLMPTMLRPGAQGESRSHAILGLLAGLGLAALEMLW